MNPRSTAGLQAPLSNASLLHLVKFGGLEREHIVEASTIPKQVLFVLRKISGQARLRNRGPVSTMHPLVSVLYEHFAD
jgi:hypothetical protein